MSTITTTVPVSATATALVPENTSFNPLERMNALAIILDTYKEWEDFLSLDLHTWAAGLMELSLTDLNQSANLAAARQQVTRLFNEILANPLNPSQMLEEPCTDGNMAWDGRYLDYYLNAVQGTSLENRSPFDESPIARRTHDFAIAVISWANTLPGVAALPQEIDLKAASGTVTLKVRKLTKAEEETIIYRILIAQKAITARKLEEQRKVVENMTANLKETASKLEDQVKVEAEAARKRADESEQVINSRISLLESTQRSTISIFNSRINDLNNRLSQNQNATANLQNTVSSQQNEIASLRATISQYGKQTQQLSKEVKQKKKKKFLGLF